MRDSSSCKQRGEERCGDEMSSAERDYQPGWDSIGGAELRWLRGKVGGRAALVQGLEPGGEMPLLCMCLLAACCTLGEAAHNAST